jgi:hypothetical protein
MARVLIVEPDTVELRVTLQAGCRAAAASQVTMTVTREGVACRELMPACDDSCNRYGPLPVVRGEPVAKVHHAIRIAPGWVPSPSIKT